MLKFKDNIKVYLNANQNDMRKSIDGLSAIVVDFFVLPPNSGNVFIFFNKTKDKVKLLFWDRNGFVLYYKRLEKGKFKISTTASAPTELSQEQLNWLLAGLDFALMGAFAELNYDNYY